MKTTAPVNAPALPVTTRRTALATLAGLGAAALAAPKAQSAMLAGPDPIFALIERHKAAYDALNAELRGPDLDLDLDAASAEDRAEAALRDQLAGTAPTTLAGLRAYANHMAAYDKRTGDFTTAQAVLATIAEACRNMVGGAA